MRRGVVRALDLHLDRFAHSARILDLPGTDRGLWRDAIERAVACGAITVSRAGANPPTRAEL